MARFFHHVGTFLLFSASVLLIITCISAPVVNDLALLKVELGGDANNGRGISFGTFGYCENNVDGDGQDDCSRARIGYSPAAIMAAADGTAFSDYAERTTRALTRAMVLHPVASALNFAASVLALAASGGSGISILMGLLASLAATLAFLATAVACVIDFVLFSIVKSNVNDRGEVTGTDAYYDAAAWTALVAAVCSLVGTVIVFFACCAAGVRRGRGRGGGVTKAEYVSPPRRRRRRRRRRFW